MKEVDSKHQCCCRWITCISNKKLDFIILVPAVNAFNVKEKDNPSSFIIIYSGHHYERTGDLTNIISSRILFLFISITFFLVRHLSIDLVTRLPYAIKPFPISLHNHRRKQQSEKMTAHRYSQRCYAAQALTCKTSFLFHSVGHQYLSIQYNDQAFHRCQ